MDKKEKQEAEGQLVTSLIGIIAACAALYFILS